MNVTAKLTIFQDFLFKRNMDGRMAGKLIYIYTHTHANICIYVCRERESVHCAGLLDVQNILSADTVVSPGKLEVIHSVIT
jgi:hypothetical protein